MLSESSYFCAFAQRQHKLQHAANRGFDFHVLRCAYKVKNRFLKIGMEMHRLELLASEGFCSMQSVV